MKFQIEGTVINKGVTKKTGKSFVTVLVPRPDGNDVVTVFTKNGNASYPVNSKVKLDVVSFVRFANEV